MHKLLTLLGLLQQGPLYGYELNRIVRAHGYLYTDLKKANLYYLLDRLAKEGDLSVQTEGGTRGARGERLIYTLTDQGRSHIAELLREILLSYEPGYTGVGAAVVFLAQLPPSEGIALLQKRRRIVAERRTQVVAGLGNCPVTGPLVHISGDHLVSLIDAELTWIDRSLTYLHEHGWAQQSGDHAHPLAEMTPRECLRPT